MDLLTVVFNIFTPFTNGYLISGFGIYYISSRFFNNSFLTLKAGEGDEEAIFHEFGSLFAGTLLGPYVIVPLCLFAYLPK